MTIQINMAIKKMVSDNLKVIKFGYSKKATKFEKIFHLEFDVTE